MSWKTGSLLTQLTRCPTESGDAAGIDYLTASPRAGCVTFFVPIVTESRFMLGQDVILLIVIDSHWIMLNIQL